jgi:hypothetical protein
VGARDDRLHTEDATRTMMVFHCLRDRDGAAAALRRRSGMNDRCRATDRGGVAVGGGWEV